MTQKVTLLSKPFLGPVFEPSIDPTIATGYNYHPEEVALHGVESHKAIDFDTDRGAKIIAPADGYYIASYGEVALTNDDGSPRTQTRASVVKHNPGYAKLHLPPGDGPWPVYFGSFVIQGWHPNGRYTQYAHVDWVNPAIPYYAPTTEDNGDIVYSRFLRAPVAEYRKSDKAVWLKAGEIIGEVGMTGCGIGKRCYSFAKLGRGGRPDFRNTDYFYYTNPHLHFMVFSARANSKARTPKQIWDPFGVYDVAGDKYPKNRSQWPGWTKKSLWL